MSGLKAWRLLLGISIAAALSSTTIATAVAFPLSDGINEGRRSGIEKVGCWLAYGPWGPHRVCRGEDYDDAHYDWHPGHWDRHEDHYDWHPGHWDYHHNGHRHHLDEETDASGYDG